MIKLKSKVGKNVIEFESQNLKEIFKFSDVISQLDKNCDNCNSNDVYLSYKNIKGNEYYLLKCKKCGAEQSLHQKKEGGFFIKYDDKMKVWENKTENQTSNKTVNQEDVPF